MKYRDVYKDRSRLVKLKRTIEFFTIYGFTASSVTFCKVPSLEHEIRNNTVECWSCVAKTMFAGREFAKILCGVRNYVIKELEDDAALSLAGDRYIELKKKQILRSDPLKY